MASHQCDAASVAESSDKFSWLSFDASSCDSFEQTDDGYSLVPFTAASAANTVTNGEQQTSTISQLHKSLNSSIPNFPMEQTFPKPARYYATALSETDLLALRQGLQNHNLRPWTPQDMLSYHESRKHLIPRVMPKPDKIVAFAEIEHDKQQSSKRTAALVTENNVVRRALHLTHIKIPPTDSRKERSEASSLLTPSGSSRSSPTASPSSTSPPFTPSKQHTRATSSSEYFSFSPLASSPRQHQHCRRISPLSTPYSPVTRSPLAHEVPPFRHNPKVTFASFLVPHESGTGETVPVMRRGGGVGR